MPVNIHSTPMVNKTMDISAVPIGITLVDEKMLITLKPVRKPRTDRISPNTPKKKRGFLSDTSTSIRVRTPIPCLKGFSVEPSSVYILVMGTSVILRLLSAARVIISDSMANPFSDRSKVSNAFLESALKPDSESTTLA